MRAAHHTSYGTPNVLSLTEVEARPLRAGEIRIAIGASAVTQGDRRLREADYPGIGHVLGRLVSGIFRPRHTIPGTTFAGRVVEVAPGVERFAVGDDVFGGCDWGAQAESLVVKAESAVTHMPENLSYAEAAALPYGAVTAMVFIRDVAKVQPGERVLILGASGGVGRYAVQMARHLGAEVTAVASRSHDRLRELGAHCVVDRNTTDWTELEADYDVVYDTSWDSRFASARKVLAPRGRYATLSMTVRVLIQMLFTALWKPARKALFAVVLNKREHMDDLAVLAADGVLQPTVARTYPLDRVVDAHAAVSFERPAGEVVVEVSPTPGGAPSRQRSITPVRLSLLRAA